MLYYSTLLVSIVLIHQVLIVSSFLLPVLPQQPQTLPKQSSWIRYDRIRQANIPPHSLYVSISASRSGRGGNNIGNKNNKRKTKSKRTGGNTFDVTVTYRNVMKQLPWNVQKEKAREQRRYQFERSMLYRQLGIVEDATYEEIVEATNALLAKAGDNIKEKIKIEVAKDSILQIRLNERLAGLSSGSNSREARAMSTYEEEGADDDEELTQKITKGFKAPSWTQNLIVKPDEKHLQSQIRLWGIITAIGVALPPAQDYLGRFTWLVCVAQLTFRGMPQEMREGGGMGMAFNMGGKGGGGHRKVAFALGLATWIVGAIIAYGFMPSWARGQRWTNTVAFAIQNLVFGIVSSYLKPYKG